MANPESMFRMIRINNRNRISGIPSNFVVDFTDDPKTHKVSEFHIHTVTLPHVFYNVRTFNKTLKFTLGLSGPQQIILKEGWYTSGDIITALENEINPLLGGGSSLTITQDDINDKFIFDITVGTDSITFDGTSPLEPFLGIITGGTASLGSTYTADDLPNLIGPANIYFESSTLNTGRNLLSARNTVNNNIITVPVNAPYKGLITYISDTTDFTDRFVFRTVRDISTIDIQVKDSYGNILELGNNHELIITIKAYYV